MSSASASPSRKLPTRFLWSVLRFRFIHGYVQDFGNRRDKIGPTIPRQAVAVQCKLRTAQASGVCTFVPGDVA